MSDFDDWGDGDVDDFDFGEEGEWEEDGSWDEDEEVTPEIEIENQYEESKDLEEDEGIETALEGLEKVLELEKSHHGSYKKYSFKALVIIIQLRFKNNNAEGTKDGLKQLLTFNLEDNDISQDKLLKGITKVLNGIQKEARQRQRTIASSSTSTGDSTTSNNADSVGLVLELYRLVLSALREDKNWSLWIKSSEKLAQTLFDARRFTDLEILLNESTEVCKNLKRNQNATLLKIYSFRIQKDMETKNRQGVKEVCSKALSIVKSDEGILESQTALFHFVKGKVLMEENEWNKAYKKLMKAFNFFQSAESSFKIPCLKYILLTTMLMPPPEPIEEEDGTITQPAPPDPFAAPEVQSLRRDRQISAMSDLLSAYEHEELDRFEKIIKDNRDALLGDPFLAQFIQVLMVRIRTDVLKKIIAPYQCVQLPFLGKQLNITTEEVTDLLVHLILDKVIRGQIDQIQQQLHLEDHSGATQKYESMEKWTRQLRSLHNSLLQKVQ